MEFKQWPYVEADKIVSRLKKLGKTQALLESGYGPSGLPHIGTFAEAARTAYVINALKVIAPEIKTRFLTFSDDMDGLRALPENIPNHELVEKHLGQPLSSIPDPYGTATSYSGNMNNLLKEFLSNFGFDFEFVSSTELYRAGVFNEGLSLIMKHHKEIIRIFTATISEDKRETWSPFFPICQNCGKITTTKVTEYDIQNNEITYTCSGTADPRIKPCGHQGKTSILNGNTKVGWKIDWALRWYTLGIDYEMYGKDLIDSCVISEKVVKLMGGKPPVTYKYELFLDEDGHKISKKLGNGVSIDEWLQYAPTDALLYFIYSHPNQPKKMALSLIPKAVDEYLKAASSYDGNLDSPIAIIENACGHQKAYESVPQNLEFSLITNLIKALNVTDPLVILDYLTRYNPNLGNARYAGFVKALILKAVIYNQEVETPKKELEIDHAFDAGLGVLINRLITMKEPGTATAESIQTLCFEIGKESGFELGKWFKHLYQVLLGADSGPRLGAFIYLYGIDATINKIEAYLQDKK
jgi:lysyl-tRNA synthetase class 1